MKMFFKKEKPKMNAAKPATKEKTHLNDYILDDKLYNFTKEMKEKLKDKDEITKLALQFEKLVKIDEEQKRARQKSNLIKKP